MSSLLQKFEDFISTFEKRLLDHSFISSPLLRGGKGVPENGP